MTAKMKRREFITLLGGAAAWPIAARAQQAERARRIGVLMNLAADDPEALSRIIAFVQGLQQLGWTEGRNMRIDTRWGAGDTARFHRYAEELLAIVPDVVLASGNPSNSSAAAGDPHSAYRIRKCRRPGRHGLGREPGAARRERHRFHPHGIRLQREMVRAAQRDRASRDAGGGASGSYDRARPVERDPGRGAVVRRGVERGRRARRRRD